MKRTKTRRTFKKQTRKNSKKTIKTKRTRLHGVLF